MKRNELTQGIEPQALSIMLDQDVAVALDRFIAEMHPGVSRAEALNLALRDWAGRSFYASPRGPILPEDLNASNDD